MTKTFFRTNNVNRLVRSMDMLIKREPRTPGLGLVFGSAGRGKSEATDWYYTNYGSFYVRAVELYTPRWFLKELALAIEPRAAIKHSTKDLFDQVLGLLRRHRQPVFIDEADYLLKKGCLEVVRDLHDLTDVPFVLIGMENLCSALLEKPQFWSRILGAAIVDWQPLTASEICLVFREWTGLSMVPGAAETLCQVREGDFRDLMSDFTELEQACKANKIAEVTGQMAQTLLARSARKKEIAAGRVSALPRQVRILGKEAV